MIKSEIICKLCMALLLFSICVFSAGAVQAAPNPGGTNGTTQPTAMQDCGTETGLFSDLLKKGAEIFNGLREIIYVVAGFGILAVAVGGFFGNLNWKWLGAIVIGLMVIASTGEILNMIVGCNDTYFSSQITDTLK